MMIDLDSQHDPQLELSVFKKLVKTKFGLDFYGKNESALIKAINTRIKANGLKGRHDYYHKLVENKDELQELICLLTINETYFYRESVQIEFLVNSLIPKIQSRYSVTNRIRILSMGCSTGAEPYSIAMELHQKFGPTAAGLFTIMGGDVDSSALKIAMAAHYKSMEFRTLSPKLKQRYFVPDGSSGFIIKPEIRRMVSFQHMNIISQTIPSDMQGMDVIFFRNVSIYFDQATRLSIHKKITSMLKPEGYLIVGMTESLANNFGLLSLKNKGDIFYFKKEIIAKTCPVQKQFPETRKLFSHAHGKLFTNKHAKKRIAKPTSNNLSSTPAITATFMPFKNNSNTLNDTACSEATYNEQTCSKKSYNKDNILVLLHEKKYDTALLLLQHISGNDHEKAKLLCLRAFILSTDL